LPTNRIDLARLDAVRARLGVVVDPGMWPEVMEQISAAVGATGAFTPSQCVRLAACDRDHSSLRPYRAKI
jgi:hypothetical protein